MPSAPGQLVPSAGAFLEFGGSLSVMCVSLAAATVYAVGTVDLRTRRTSRPARSLHMKFGFGAEIVGRPAGGRHRVGALHGRREIDVETGAVTVAAFLLFRGRAELIGGHRHGADPDRGQGHRESSRRRAAQRWPRRSRSALDISIFLVINLHFSKSWEESRQIA